MSKVKGIYLYDSTKTGGKNVAYWRIRKPIVDNSHCARCRICIGFCPEAAICFIDNQIKIDYRFCKGCGICSNECPVEAIKLVKERE